MMEEVRESVLGLLLQGTNPIYDGFLVKNLPANVGDRGPIPGSGRSPGKGNSNPLQYSRLENLNDRGAWQATIHVVTRVRHDLATKERER